MQTFVARSVFWMLLPWIVVQEVFHLCRHVISVLFGHLPSEKLPLEKTVIVLVHGYLGYPQFFSCMARRLQKKTPCSLVTVYFPHSRSSIKEDAYQIEKKILSLTTTPQNHRWILVGASRGGVVASYFTEYFSTRSSVPVVKVFTLASPLGGTYTAQRWTTFKTVVDDIGHHSLLTQELQKKIANNRQTEYYHFIPSHDYMMLPRKSGWIGTHPERESLWIGYCHNTFFYSNAVARYIAERCETAIPLVKI